MTEQEAMFCLKAESERYPEICNECPLHGEVGCDHCFDDAMDVAIRALEEIQQYRASVSSVDVTQAILKEEYNKAIDDFLEKIQREYLNGCGIEQKEIEFLIAVSSQVAEQLKRGDGE